jgi:hypothetical protein
MARLKKRLLLVLAGIVFLLLVLVLFFYRPTRLALERAEAFQFRRMIVTRLDDQNTYRFFFATNRRLENGDDSLEERFGNQRQERLRFGLFDTAIKPTLGLGMIINPSDWFRNEEIQLSQVESLSQSDFAAHE